MTIRKDLDSDVHNMCDGLTKGQTSTKQVEYDEKLTWIVTFHRLTNTY